MIRLTKLALKRPVTIILCLVTIVYFGFQSLMGARMELIPEMELPMLLISTVYAGASPDDVEELITSKQEDAVSTLSGIDTVQSYSMENVSVVMIQYEYGTNMDTAYINLKKAMDGIQSQMPEDAGDPNILEMDINAMPSIMLSGIMFPVNLLPKALEMTGSIFPASWGYKLMLDDGFKWGNLWYLLFLFFSAVIVCGFLLKNFQRE